MTNQNLEKKLRNVKIENGEITALEFMPAKTPDPFMGIKFAAVPDICRVSVKLRPSPVSDIKFDLCLPTKEWNGNFLGMGSGGPAGRIDPIALINGTSRGYATANTDMGSSLNTDELVGKRERWIDYGYRATHLMTTVCKQLIKAFYGKAAKYSYFFGGSTGGQQALMEAQRYPEDYDGIAVLCPANNRVKLHASFIWNWQALTATPNSAISATEAAAIQRRLVKNYGEKSGSAPGDAFLSYPGNIKVDMSVLNDGAEPIIKPEQLDALSKLYAGPADPVTGEKFFVPFSIGSEGSALSLADLSNKEKFAKEFFWPFSWFLGTDFDFSKFDFHKDLENAMKQLSPILDATDTDLSAFKKRGGKLIMVTGSVDAIIPYQDARNYYEKVVEKQKGLKNTVSFFRYFHVPGLGHGFGGAGFQEIGSLGLPSVSRDKEHDILSAVVNWVENGEAPERLLPVAFVDGNFANEVSHDRPIYPYPYVTEYVSGDIKNRDSFRKGTGIKAY